ncbi:hypothetical protein [Mycobacteroides abscessus]|uniref:hypothetical protein n=1 Tax=Mycobacteroides abscessus TaxID=36809 RepID=UPI00092AF046|nr:hypothetical protein [Mycobacteroides abscessus]SIC59203.1 Uncharacterised protein [Mycobacteroides abscessus subsp. abscessus]
MNTTKLVAQYQNEYDERYVVSISTTPRGRHHVLLTDKAKGTVYLKGNFLNGALEQAQALYDELKRDYLQLDNVDLSSDL